jgi:hypothetical protein
MAKKLKRKASLAQRAARVMPEIARVASAPQPVPVSEPASAAEVATGPGIPLNFRVTADFRRAFRTAAAQHDMRLSELLVASFDAWAERDKGR